MCVCVCVCVCVTPQGRFIIAVIVSLIVLLFGVTPKQQTICSAVSLSLSLFDLFQDKMDGGRSCDFILVIKRVLRI